MEEKNVMTVEEYLGQYLKIEDEIQSEKEYIASLKAIVENTTTHLSFTAGRNPSKDNGKFENTMLDIVEAERKYDEKLRDLGLKQAEIANLINRVPDERMRSLLLCRYIKGGSMQDAAVEIGVTRQHAYKIHKSALKKIWVNHFFCVIPDRGITANLNT